MNDKGWFTVPWLLVFLVIGAVGFVERCRIAMTLGISQFRALVLVLWAISALACAIAFAYGLGMPAEAPSVLRPLLQVAVGIGLLVSLAAIFLVL